MLVASVALVGLIVGVLPRVVDPSPARSTTGDDPARLVDPFVGTAPQHPDVIPGDGVGGAFPGASAPFGMLQWSPDTSGRSASGSGGYRYADSTIDGFSLTHLHGTACPAAQDLAIMPTASLPTQPPTGAVDEPSPWAAGFSHHDESATPGRYQVRIAPSGGGGIDVDLAAGARTAIGRFSYPAGSEAMLTFDAGRRADGAQRADVRVDAATGAVTGSVTSRTFCRQPAVSTLYFVAQPDRPPTTVGTWSAGHWSSARDASDVGGATATSRSASAGAWLRLPLAADNSVTLRVAVSYVSVEGARANLTAEYPAAVDTVAQATRAEWNRRLSAVQVASAPLSDLRTLYTALYHVMLGPVTVSDTDGRYVGWDGSAGQATGWVARSGIAGWDAYRSTFPLLALLAPDVATDAARSLLAAAAQTGSVPGWTLATGDAGIMPGDGGTVLLAQAVAFGLPIDPAAALTAALDTADRRPFAAEYARLGFVPAPPIGPTDAASITLEYALTDFAVAQLASAAQRPDLAATFTTRSARWRSVWDPDAGLPAPRDPDGRFHQVEPVTIPGFTEGNAEQYAWLVPQDPSGLAGAMGGWQTATRRLETFLSRVDDGPTGAHAAMGNQPSQLVPWLGDSFGAPALTAATLDRVRHTLYRDSPDGLPGNDDTGGLSAWYVLAWLGLGPAQPGTDMLALAPPAATSITIALPSGPLHLLTPGAENAESRVPAGLRRDGHPISGPWIRFQELTRGTVLEWSLSDQPTAWGTDKPSPLPPPATDAEPGGSSTAR
ncbi:GH92 family glycosyl hydrolase [Pseudofrankia sp. BMG5.36]|uniref:GH92 family glycosyl hydrolase n=1 Tax=Pseudofrankia sp. BMG5.36 TaxID=1834512 RepID=UPI000B276245|nr:GH92 family glycosyl hydrolase [Pseudofrankia sp. BMG5.36]